MTPWRSWAVAWRNHAHHCPPCLANVRSSHCEAEGRTQIFDQNPQSQSLPFPVSAPHPGSPLALNWEHVAMRREHSTPFPLSAHIPEMRVGYVAWTWCRCCKIVVSSAVLSLVSSQEMGGGRKTSQFQHSWVTCRNSAPDVCWLGSSAVGCLALYPLRRGILFQTSSVRGGIHVPQSFPRFRLVQI